MPELAEVAGFAKVCNDVSTRVFSRCWQSEVHKGPRVAVPFAHFTVRAQARGKEMILTLRDCANAANALHVRFRFGMTGCMRFFEAGEEVHKHAHFLMADEARATLCFVDPRRFGSWEKVASADAWGADRSPCPVTEWEQFGAHVASKLPTSAAWNKPVCETLLDQTLFNGIGNYLRAEILHEVGTRTGLVLAHPVAAGRRGALLAHQLRVRRLVCCELARQQAVAALQKHSRALLR